MTALPLFYGCVDRIVHEYERLGHRLGWRFLYSPRATLRADVPILLAGANPGGSYAEPPLASVESGNAFRVERWPGTGSGHQAQVTALLEQLRLAVDPASTMEGFADSTLTANFCPFRSPSLGTLVRRKESLAFSVDLWLHIFQEIMPRVILCNGVETATLFAGALEKHGFRSATSESYPTGWGDYHYRVTSLGSNRGEIVLFGLPHLGRFRFIERDPTVTKILVEQIAATLA